MFVPRNYQSETIAMTADYLARGGKGGLVCLPTGTGKASLPAFSFKDLFKKQPFSRVMMITHRKTLIKQNYETLKLIWPEAPCGIYSAGLKKKDQHDAITYAGIQSVYKKAELFGRIDVIIIDEAHLISQDSATMYGLFIGQLRERNPKLVVIGMTATPFRLDSGMLLDGDLFDEIIVDRTLGDKFTWFIDQHYLCDLHAKDVDGRFDLNGVKKSGGEYLISALTAKFNRTEVSQKIVNETIRLRGSRRRAICFAISIEHAEELARMFNEAGVPATMAHSKLEESVSERNVADFKSGLYEVLVDVERYTTGFDYPAIDLIVMARPTESASLWIQMCGRGTRPVYAKGFDLTTLEGRAQAITAGSKPDGCLLLDFAGNGLRLGPMNAPITVANKAETTFDGVMLAPQKICPQCLTYVHAAKRYCEGHMANETPCDYEFPQGQEVAMSGDIVPGVLIRRDFLREDRMFDVIKHTVLEGRSSTGKPFITVTIITKGLQMPISVTMYMTDAAYPYSKEVWRVLLKDIMFPYITGGNMESNIKECMNVLETYLQINKVVVWVNHMRDGKINPKLLEVG